MHKWMEQAITDLQMLEQRRMAVEGIGVRIRQLDADAASLSGRSFGTAPMKGGGNRQEAWLCALADSKSKLEQEREAMQATVEHTEKCLQSLPEQEQEVLTEMYTKQQYRGVAVKRLEERLHIGRSEVYRIRERALQQFALRMGYGVR